MITEAIRDASDCADLILDPFAGSGTAPLAADRCGRRARLIELDPHYCDLIVSRAKAADLSTKLVGTNQSFEEVTACRLAEQQPARSLADEQTS